MPKLLIPKTRAPNLDEAHIEAICRVLDGWEGKLTWELLIDAIEARRQVRYTRQALNQHARVKHAFQLTKERLRGQPRNELKIPQALGPLEAQALMERYDRLEAENARLKVENDRLIQQFIIWASNASNRGLDVHYLNQPLQQVDREVTKLRKQRSR